MIEDITVGWYARSGDNISSLPNADYVPSSKASPIPLITPWEAGTDFKNLFMYEEMKSRWG
jgi:hypothetical protein